MKGRKALIVAFGFGQSIGLSGTAVGQNQFADERCQTDPQGLECFDAGCSDIGGRCESQQGQLPPGQPGQEDQNDTQQGCVCVGGFEPQSQCKEVHNQQTGEQQCVDLGCPPMQNYNCDPASCECGEPQDFGDEKCQPNFKDPQQCEDNGCSQMGGICETAQAQGPHNPNDPQDGIGGCHCRMPGDPQGQPRHCEFALEFPSQLPICLDFECGAMDAYDCEFDFAPMVCDGGGDGSAAGIPCMFDDECRDIAGPGARCVGGGGFCDCICDSLIPLGGLEMIFTTKVDFEWTGAGSFCASVYNVYRQSSFLLPDMFPPFTVADDYGLCLYSGLLVSHATDLMVPPSTITQHYLVTPESPAGEGPLGFTSSGFFRPFYANACPSPPPLP